LLILAGEVVVEDFTMSFLKRLKSFEMREGALTTN